MVNIKGNTKGNIEGGSTEFGTNSKIDDVRPHIDDCPMQSIISVIIW